MAGWAGHGLVSRAIAAPALGFKPGLDVGKWQTELRARLRSILMLPSAGRDPLDARVARHRETAQYTMDRIQFTAEPGEVVPGWLLKPKSARGPLPVMICLQGHSPGMHISIGEARNEAERKSIAGGRDLALQAVANGWAALVVEQRAFGERARPGVTRRCSRCTKGGRSRGSACSMSCARSTSWRRNATSIQPGSGASATRPAVR